jgi:hypothetical protein
MWMVHHDNARAHMLLLVCEFLAKRKWTVIQQPPCFPHLAPVEFFVPKVEIHSERSPILDGRKDRRKFTMGPMCYPAKRVPELAKTLESIQIVEGSTLKESCLIKL